jgi:glutamate racemase
MIGVFDSGYGGLSVLKKILKLIPDYDYLYLGDNERVPYGDKSPDLIYDYTRQAVEFLFSRDCRLIILACNTASAVALRKLQQEFLPANFPDRRILGVIRPIAEALAEGRSEKIGVIGTKATVESGAYIKEIAKINPAKKVFEKSTPRLVPLIESGLDNHELIKPVLKKYLKFLFENKIEELVLGCTHYPLIFSEVEDLLPEYCRLREPGDIIARSLADYLDRHPELKICKKKPSGQTLFFTTGHPEVFMKKGGYFLGKDIPGVEKIDLKEYCLGRELIKK